jgi:hypothetical protein
MIKLLPRVFGAPALRRGPAVAAAVAMLAVLGTGSVAHAQAVARPTGNVSVLADWFPNRGDTTELRTRLFVEEEVEPVAGARLTVSGFVEGLTARRPDSTGLRAEGAAIARLHEATVEVRLGRVDLYAGYGRAVWGRLDELQPTDVINPLDVSRFFFDGRSEARLAVTVVRGRVYFTDDVSLEAVYVPVFRRGRFDQLEEPTSPFNIVPLVTDEAACLAIGCPAPPLPTERLEPSTRWSSAQGGARFDATVGRFDWSVSAYRGFEPFGLYRLRIDPSLTPSGAPRAVAEETFPRFTMIGADFETVAGDWGIRGEAAAFVEDSFQTPAPGVAGGSSFDAGAGVDRRAGDYHVSATILFHRESPDLAALPPGRDPAGAPSSRDDLSLIVSADRTFARERYGLRGFSVYNPSEGSAFLRAVGTAKVHDDAAVEVSGGWFPGDGRDTIGRFGDSDFLYARLKYYW